MYRNIFPMQYYSHFPIFVLLLLDVCYKPNNALLELLLYHFLFPQFITASLQPTSFVLLLANILYIYFYIIYSTIHCVHIILYNCCFYQSGEERRKLAYLLSFIITQWPLPVLFVCVNWNYHLRPLAFSVISCSTSSEVALLTINPFSFCLSWIVFVSPLFLNDSYADTEFLLDSFFFEEVERVILLFRGFHCFC